MLNNFTGQRLLLNPREILVEFRRRVEKGRIIKEYNRKVLIIIMYVIIYVYTTLVIYCFSPNELSELSGVYDQIITLALCLNICSLFLKKKTLGEKKPSPFMTNFLYFEGQSPPREKATV